jgi:hypothetical protein
MRTPYGSILFLSAAATFAVVAACSSSSSGGPSSDGGTTSHDSAVPVSDAAVIPDATVASCASPGGPTPGPADTHCIDTDGGLIVQPTSEADCHPDVGAPDGGDDDCPYDTTKYGTEAYDDDCKYHVSWSSTPLCEETSAGKGAVIVTVVATNLGDGSPLTGANTIVEFFTTTPGDASCDDMSTHPGFNSGVMLAEGPPGTYTGPLYFDAPGQWTMRFHFHEECADILDDSPHGHAAFHLTLP